MLDWRIKRSYCSYLLVRALLLTLSNGRLSVLHICRDGNPSLWCTMHVSLIELSTLYKDNATACTHTAFFEWHGTRVEPRKTHVEPRKSKWPHSASWCVFPAPCLFQPLKSAVVTSMLMIICQEKDWKPVTVSQYDQPWALSTRQVVNMFPEPRPKTSDINWLMNRSCGRLTCKWLSYRRWWTACIQRPPLPRDLTIHRR